jgi:hypothetical protein
MNIVETMELRKMNSWVAVDLDRTLAYYESGDFHKNGPFFIGAPIQPMVAFVQQLIEEGKEVRIFTARLQSEEHDTLPCNAALFNQMMQQAIGDWTELHIGRRLIATNIKDWCMETLYDDRAVQVRPNQGTFVEDAES